MTVDTPADAAEVMSAVRMALITDVTTVQVRRGDDQAGNCFEPHAVLLAKHGVRECGEMRGC